MRTFVLFLVCLTAGCRARAKGKNCKEEGVKFTCKEEKCEMAGVKGTPLQRVIINYSEVEKQQETVNRESRITFKLDEDRAPPFHHTAYRMGTTTIACNLDHLINSSSAVMLFCKQSHSECIPSSDFNLKKTSSGFNITLSKLTDFNSGVYWCGLKEIKSRRRRPYSAALKKIQLSVKGIKYFRRSWTVGQNYSYYCNYKNFTDVDSRPKFVCKGDDPHECQTVATASTPVSRTFSLSDDRKKRNITVTVRELTEKDSGTYWCGAETPSGECGNVFINKLSLTVLRPQSSTSASPLSRTAAASVGSHIGAKVLITVSVCVVGLLVLLLLFVTVLILVYKRFSASKHSAAPNTKENYIYEEIRERPLTPHSGTVVNTIYTTATLPTMHPASLHYATIDIVRRSDGAAGDSHINKQESCHYSTVKYKQSAASSSSSCSSSPSSTTSP